MEDEFEVVVDEVGNYDNNTIEFTITIIIIKYCIDNSNCK